MGRRRGRGRFASSRKLRGEERRGHALVLLGLERAGRVDEEPSRADLGPGGVLARLNQDHPPARLVEAVCGLAELLAGVLPPKLQVSYFTNSGTEAVMAAHGRVPSSARRTMKEPMC